MVPMRSLEYILKKFQGDFANDKLRFIINYFFILMYDNLLYLQKSRNVQIINIHI